MNFNIELFMNILWLSTLCGTISSICIQKLKESLYLTSSRFTGIMSIIISIFIGFFVSLLFTSLSLPLSLFVGLISWIGGQSIYKQLKSRNIMKSSSDLFEIKN